MTTSVSPPATTGTTAGVTTMDKVFIISGADAIEVAYGFNIDPNAQDLERKGYTSDYSLARGIICPDNINTYYAHSPWWLRTPGTSQHSVLFTTEFGEVITDIGVLEDAIGVRPAIIINTT